MLTSHHRNKSLRRAEDLKFYDNFITFVKERILLGEIQEAIFEEKIFRIFFTQKKVFFLASQYKTGLYLDLLLENRI